MIKNLSVFLDKKFLVPLFLFLLVGFLTSIHMPWDDPIDDAIISLEHKIRGERFLDSSFAVVYLGDEDIEALGGWPITRDYYSYLIHILKASGAKVIAIDVLFAKADNRNPEYDATLTTFLHSAGNVCLPMIFSELYIKENNKTEYGTHYNGDNPTWPLKQFQNYAAATGFSNFSKSDNVLKVPIAADNGDTTLFSFGAQMAVLFLAENVPASAEIKEQQKEFSRIGTLQINHFGNIDKVQSLSFLELLKLFHSSPDSLNFNGKLVLFTITSPGVSSIKSTPLSTALPASLIHLTVAENLVNKNYLMRISLTTQIVILVIILFAVFFANHFEQDRIFILFSVGFLILLWIISLLFFSYLNLVVPVFYPTLGCISAFLYFLMDRNTQKRLLQSSMNDLMQKQIEIKENQLEEVRRNLDRKTTDQKNELHKLEKELNDLKIYSAKEVKSLPGKNFNDIIYSGSSPMAHVLDLVLKVSPNDIPVLILGETGTGKELIARAIHETGARKNKPFVAVNCGALSETLLESELFGHEKGSFTGALTMRKGRFELADGGSIFLDEISETSPAFQVKLLRVLQESVFERLGAEQTLKTDMRIIAATNKNLQNAIDNNRFRSDLFYRLNGFPIQLPPLKERQDDIPMLCRHFLKKHKFELDISEQAINVLLKYHWPGNVRELENYIRRAAIIVQSENRNLLQESDFPAEITTAVAEQTLNGVHKPIENQILEMLQSLKFSHSSISQTAKLLGNRDRGTITEYFRGICFEYYVKAGFDIDIASKEIAGSEDEQVLELVKGKINTYLENIIAAKENKPETLFKGLPKKYHSFLEKVISNLNKQ